MGKKYTQAQIDAADYEMRLIMLVGVMSDELATVTSICEGLKLRHQTTNTRSDLSYLIQLHGELFFTLQKIAKQVEELRNTRQYA